MARAKKNLWPERLWLTGLLVLAVFYALPSLGYPLGRNQAASYYVAREWWQHNVIPYEDSFDPRMPGIHFVYLMANLFFGVHSWSIRLFELIVLLGAGLGTAQAAARRRLTAVEVGPVVLTTVGFYFTFVDYWDSANADIWCAICLMLAQYTVSGDKNRRHSSIVTGLWTGTAVILKPQALLFVPVLVAQLLALALAERPEPEKWPTIVEIPVAYVVGLIQPLGFFVAYFLTRHGLHSFWSCITSHVPTEGHALAAMESWSRRNWIALAAAGALFVVGLLLRSRQSKPVTRWFVVVAPVSLLTALLAILIQGSFESCQLVLAVPFIALCAAEGILALGAIAKVLPTLAAIGLVALFYVAAPPWSSNPQMSYRTQTVRFWQHARGTIDREAYLYPAFVGERDYVYRDEELLSRRIAALAQPGDMLYVRGREPAIYALSGLQSPARVFASDVTADENFLDSHPPRFFVTTAVTGPEDSLLRRGYRPWARIGRFTLLTR